MHLQRFSNPAPESFDGFGMVVALDGDLAAVGAPTDSRLSTWVGEVYVFDTTSGALVTTIANPTPIIGSQFGRSLAFVAGNLVVGAPGDPGDTNDSGRVHVFDPRSGVLLGTIMNPGPEPTRANLFGWSMAALGTEVVVSAPCRDRGSCRDQGPGATWDSAACSSSTPIREARASVRSARR